jgi:hypothetical protein
MKLTAQVPPFEELVEWACHPACGLHVPADRPWYAAMPPPRDTPYWEYRCHCQRLPVRVKRYACVGGKGWIYLGQCKRCQAVVWTFQAKNRQTSMDPLA